MIIRAERRIVTYYLVSETDMRHGVVAILNSTAKIVGSNEGGTTFSEVRDVPDPELLDNGMKILSRFQ